MSQKREREQWTRLLDDLRERGVVVEDGLTETETRDAEYRFGFHFPPDLRALLQTGLPVSERFPDWRDGDEKWLRERLRWPLEGMQFDIQNNAFWLAEWGPRPESLDAAFQVAAQAVAEAPRLILIRAHSYLPTEPDSDGNPVFSVYQTDIIIGGRDLSHYLSGVFAGWDDRGYTLPQDVRQIRFWSALAG
jgi:hypothetical protein